MNSLDWAVVSVLFSATLLSMLDQKGVVKKLGEPLCPSEWARSPPKVKGTTVIPADGRVTGVKVE